MKTTNLSFQPDVVAAFCRLHHIRKLAVFGSVLRDDFRPESDVDVLVEFEKGHIPGLLGLASIEIAFSKLVNGRPVDMNTPNSLSPFFREVVLAEAQVLYEQT